MASFKFSAMARYLTFKFLFFKFELLNLASNRRDSCCFKRRKMLVIATALFWCGGFHFKFSAIKQLHAFKFKTTLILKMIAVFTALKMPLSIRVQGLFALNLTQIKTNGNYLALKFLYFKFNMIQSYLKLQNNSPNAIKTLLLASKAC